jgi:hypothetical protein
MFEHRSQAPLSAAAFARRQASHALAAFGIVAGSLAIGTLGYHWTERLGWIDAFLNASMILTGMGPVDPMHSTAGKLFASFYALYSGVVFLVTVGIVSAPVVHRFLHRFHLEMDEEDADRVKEL